MPNKPAADMHAVANHRNSLEPQNWVEQHADYLYGYALNRLNNEELARDLVQDTFLSALEKMATFRGDSSERTWLTAIIKYKIIDVYRKKSNVLNPKALPEQVSNEENFFDEDHSHWREEHWPAPFGTENHDPLHNKEFMMVLQKCMGKLPALWMAVFTMKHVDEQITETICKELRISASNYWVIMHRAKINLRSCLQKNWI